MQHPILNIKSEEPISIALAIYNGAKYLKELLSSLENQTVKPLELVVVDDCSSDDSIKIVQDFPLSFEKKVCSNEKNMGPVYTFKKLAELCSGNFIAFCDQDDIWLPQKLEHSLQAIKEISDDIPGIIFSDLSVIDENGKPIHESYWKVRHVTPDRFSFVDILFSNIITGCTVMINKAMIGEFLKMPSNVMMHDHWLALIGYSFGKYSFINEPTVLFRSHGNSVTSKSKVTTLQVFLNDFKNRDQYLQKNIQQAIEFKNLYFSKLSNRDAKTITQFIKLQQKPFFYKRLRKDSRSLFRRLS